MYAPVFIILIDTQQGIMFNQGKTYTVSQLCRETRLLLEGHFLTVLIEGELSNLSRPASGHIYFTLKDQQAQIQCAMFRPQLRKIGFKPDNGTHVLLKARVSLYEARGNFQLIAEHIDREGMPPTRAEIASTLGFRSPNAAEDHLKALERKGAIEVMPGTSRGIRLLTKPNTGIPVVGRVAAGNPILAEEHIERHCQLDPKLFQPRADYFLKVRGQSMRDIGIMNGDLLAVHRTQEATSGQIVVARLDDEVTVKRYRQRGNIVRLLPENDDFEPIVVDLRSQNLVIEGLAVGVIRDTL